MLQTITNLIDSSSAPIICLMGPTASGKTKLALEIAQKLPIGIISVDSGMVYRGLDIGTAKPTREELTIAPHHLVDICDPSIPYSAGQFCDDATTAINQILQAGQIPLLVGGTMLYFKALQQGLTKLPKADHALREKIAAQAAAEGWPKLHEYLNTIDPTTANKIKPNDKQRIQRAIEVYQLTGKPLSYLITTDKPQPSTYQFKNLVLTVDRKILHQRIEQRVDKMLAQGLIDEVRELFKRPDLHKDLPALRAVGYRQVWEYLENKMNLNTLREKIIIATRRLAKHQLTWLQSQSRY